MYWIPIIGTGTVKQIYNNILAFHDRYCYDTWTEGEISQQVDVYIKKNRVKKITLTFLEFLLEDFC